MAEGTVRNAVLSISIGISPKNVRIVVNLLVDRIRQKRPKSSVNIFSAVTVTPSIVSVATTKRGNRRFVTKDESGNWICLNNNCRDRRAMHVNSGEPKQYMRAHQ